MVTLRMAHSMAVLRVSEEFGHLRGWQLLCDGRASSTQSTPRSGIQYPITVGPVSTKNIPDLIIRMCKDNIMDLGCILILLG